MAHGGSSGQPHAAASCPALAGPLVRSAASTSCHSRVWGPVPVFMSRRLSLCRRCRRARRRLSRIRGRRIGRSLRLYGDSIAFLTDNAFNIIAKNDDADRTTVLSRVARVLHVKVAAIRKAMATWTGSPYQPVPVASDVRQRVALRRDPP